MRTDTKVCGTLFLTLASGMAATAALAHAELQQAVPSVGGTVQVSPKQLMLRFSEGIEPRFTSVTLSTDAGGAVPVGAVVVRSGEAGVVTVRIGKPLRPATYLVNWRATSVDSHKTQGSYSFTVAP